MDASGKQMAIVGTANIWVSMELTKFKKRILVIVLSSFPDDEPLLLGLPEMDNLKLLPKG